MSGSKTPIPSSDFICQFDSSLIRANIHKTNLVLTPSIRSTTMWRNIAKRAVSRTSERYPISAFRPYSYLGFSQDSFFYRSSKLGPLNVSSGKPHDLDLRRNGDFLVDEDCFGGSNVLGCLRNQGYFNDLCPKRYASLAEAEVVSSTDIEEDVSVFDEIQELMQEMRQASKVQTTREWQNRKLKMIGGLGYKKYQTLKRRQVKIETEAWAQAAKEYKELLVDMCKQRLAPNLPYVKSLFLGWFEPLRDRIAEEQELIRQGKLRANYAAYMDQLPADKMSVIIMHKMMSLLMTGGEHGSAKVIQASCIIGEAIEQEVRICKFLEKTKRKKLDKKKQEEEAEADPGVVEQQKLRKRVTNLMKQRKLRVVGKIVKQQDDSKPWAPEAKAKVGSHLIELLIQTAYIQHPPDQSGEFPPDLRPAFMHKLITLQKEATKTSRRYGIIQCDPLVLKGLDRTARHMVIPYMPMLVPPLQWAGYEKGAYLFLPSYIMRTHGSKQQREVVKRTPKMQLRPIFEALDTLGNTRWRVNQRVLTVVDRVWASGGCLAGLVDRSDFPLPEKPETEDEALIKSWKWKVKAAKKVNRERHSQRCDVELKLAVARKMRDEEGFFYPHNLDFRGRAYPMHPYLNHLGSDLCRGILEFSEGRPLGESGLRWLKIHLANLYAGGIDKLPHEGRVAFTESHQDDILESADEPLEGKRWWLNAEDPFQCLAVCIDIAAALRSPSPETYISHIPVHQDGSCNGLQHYAALGRDKLGAAAVNLVGGEKPADVYSGIAAKVLDIMRKDAEQDPAAFPDALHAKQLINQVDRKLVKQTVMTSVYGVTYVGAREQIKRRLKERGAISDDEELFRAACYAAKITLAALGEMFQAARGIMSWLGDCAKIIASENQPVRWTSPLGLPVVQPYRKLARHLIKTSLQVLTLQKETEKVLSAFCPILLFPMETLFTEAYDQCNHIIQSDLVMIKRQRTAFPPNFVHSLDGSHMMMTAVACKKGGLNFAGVHDSYWTHACDVDKMNLILREKFVELYRQPILENLLESFQRSFPKLEFPPLPDRGTFDLREVLDSPYFFN